MSLNRTSLTIKQREDFEELVNNCTQYRKYKSLGFTYDELRFISRIGKVSEIMTPQEQLFADFFNHEKLLVKDMDMLTLRAHREGLQKIAFEARARLSSVDDEEKTRAKRTNKDKVTGFERSLNIDESSSAAINTIKERQKRLTKVEKIQAGLEKLGISSTDAVKLMQAGTIKAAIEQKNETRSPLSQNNGFVIAKSPENIEAKTEEIKKPVFNPFIKSK